MVHATCVALGHRGMLIEGPSGAGKSALALQLIACGAVLVSDDRTALSRPDAGAPLAEPVASIAGLIEARGVGLLRCKHAPSCRLAVVVDLSVVERERLPEPRSRHLLGCALPLLHKVESAHFAPSLLQYLKCVQDDPT